MQQHPLLQTKLYIPPVRSELVSRPRLIERLNEGLATRGGFPRALTLISARAGFGKTTLTSEWVTGCSRLEPKLRAAWLSLDEGDNDPARFLAYMIAALRTIALPVPSVAEGSGVEGSEPQQDAVGLIGTGALSALRSPQPPPAEAVLTSLIEGLVQQLGG